jgi:S1-C subfamily serine protease
LIRYRVLVLTLCLLGCGAAPAVGQFKTDLVNEQGATAPCMGIGPVGGPAAKKCVEMVLDAGFIKVDDLGYTGLTIGTAGNDDGAITAIQPDSAAAKAGLQVGDIIMSVEDRSVKPTPGRVATKAVFGPRGEALHLTVRRGSAQQEVSLVRTPQNAPQGPKSPNFFLIVRPVVNWQGQFVPCMGAGPLAPVALEACAGRFKPYGYIKAGEYSSTGFQLNLERTDSAIISAVDADSAAAKAGIQAGDEIVAVEGKPLAASAGEEATQRMFGKVGDQFHIKVRRGGTDASVVLQLGAKPQG